MKRIALASSLALAALLSLFAQPSAAQPEPARPAPKEGYVEITGGLVIEPPVNILGPAVELMREVRVGDLVVLQIRYPIVPPMPQSVTITSDNQAIAMVSTARSAAEAAILSRQPRTNGKIGIGYVQLLVRPAKAGQQHFTAHIKLSDGSVKNVPFGFDVKPGIGP